MNNVEKKLKKDFPQVSVVVTTFNRVNFLRKTVESILPQTFHDFELIIVDNMSGDGTDQYAKSIKDPRVSFYKNNNNGVIAVNRNFAIENSSGKYIAFCDDDDVWLPEKLEKQIQVIESSPKIGMVYARYKTIENDIVSNDFLPRENKFSSGNIFKLLYVRQFIACSSVMVKRAVLQEIGLLNTNIDFIAIEDSDLWLRIALKYEIKCSSNEPLLLYRIVQKSASQGYFKKMKRVFLLAKKYRKDAGIYLFCKVLLLNLASILKQKYNNKI